MARAFTNWAGTVRSTPARWAAPASEAEVADLVRRAARAGERVCPVGSGHSWSPIAAPDEIALSLRELDRVVAVSDDRVTVEAGCTLRALLDVLARHELALPIVGSIDAQTIAGVTATATHGSSLVHGNLSAAVRGLRLVDGSGRLVELDERDPRLAGARVHLGVLGVITQVTLAVVPAFRLRETLTRAPFDEVAGDLEGIARSAEYVKVWWLPGRPEAYVYRYERTDEPGEISDLSRTIEGAKLRWLFPLLLRAGGAAPAAIPWIHALVDATSFPVGHRIGRSDRVLTVPAAPVHRETEMAIPLERGGEALTWLRDWLVAHRARADFIFEARFVPADVAWASPAWGRDTCQLGVYGARSPDVDAIFDAFRARAARAWDGRPHVGKEHADLDPLDRLPRLGDLLALSAEIDPEARVGSPWSRALRARHAARHPPATG